MAQYIGNSPQTILLQTKRETYTYSATSGQTVFSGLDTHGEQFVAQDRSQVLVYVNGNLVEPKSYLVNPTSVVLSTPVASADEVVIITEIESALVSSFTRAETVAEINNVFGSLTLDDLTDVDLTTTSPLDGQTLVWDSVAGQFVPGDSFSQADFDTAFTAKSTTDLAEGTNLYYTDARVGNYLTSNNYATQTYVDTEITDAVAGLINSAPGALDTLGELAAALGDDADFASNVTNSIAQKLNTTDFTSTANTWLTTKNTGDLTEGSNLYFTVNRARNSVSASGDLSYNPSTGVFSVTTYKSSDFSTDFSAKTTSDLIEGSNLYYTDARVGSYLNTNAYATQTYVATYLTDNNYATESYVNDTIRANTDELPEGTTNLYYTDARVGSYLTTNSYATQTYVQTTINNSVSAAVSDLIDAAPETLDTLNELAAALGDDPNFAATITAEIGTKLATADFTSTANNWLATKTTDSLAEGSNNLYYTLARANGAIDARVTKSFVENLGIGASGVTGLATVATTGSYTDLINTPSIPATLLDLGILDGTLGQVLSTDGAGGFVFIDPGATVVVSGTAPTSPDEGDLWFDNVNTGQLYAYVGGVWLSTAGLTTLEFSSVGDLSDVDISTVAPTDGQALVWDAANSKFVPGDSFSQSEFDTAFAAKSTSDLSEGTNLYYTDARFDTRLATKSTTDLAEGTNLYYTDARVGSYLTTNSYATEGFVNTAINNLVGSAPEALDTLNELAAALGDDANFATTVATQIGEKLATSDFTSTANAWLDTKSTTDITEGTNLYYTDARFDTRLASKSTTDIAEGTNLYYTDTRANAAIDTRVTKSYVEALGIETVTSLLELGITDGTAGQVLSTDGAGSFSFIDAGATVVVSGTAPASPSEGDLWFDNVNTGQLYAYIGTSWLSTAGLTTLEFSSVGDLSDVDITTAAPADGDTLVWDAANSKFIPGTSFSSSDVNASIDARVTKSFVDALNVDADTLDGLDSTAFATSAQGALADSAVQPGDNISTLTNDANFATESYVDTAISDLVGSAPAALDTLNELAAALGDDANFATTVTNSIATKLATADFTSTADTWLGTKTTSDLAEGANLYYTVARANSAFDTRLATKSTTDLAEGTNLYYTDARFDTQLATKTTDDLDEGSTNLYYTDTRANDAIDARVTKAYVEALGIETVTSILDLGITDGTSGQVLTTDGSGNFTFTTVSSGGGGGAATLDELSDVVITTPVAGEVLSYNGTEWVNGNSVNGSNYTGTLDISSTFITRTYTGNGATTTYSVTSGNTSHSLIVTIQGVVQTPETDYTVSGDVLTFAEAPDDTTAIQIRELIRGASVQSLEAVSDDFVGDGTTTTFTLSGTPESEEYTIVNVEGVLQVRGVSYTISGDDIVFTSAPDDEAEIQVTTFVKTVSNVHTISTEISSLKIPGGTSGQVLSTDGDGNLSFITVSGGGGGGASVTVSGTAPIDPELGDLWFDDVTTGELYIYDGADWFAVSGGAGGATVLSDLTDILLTNPATGDFLQYNGNSWVNVSSVVSDTDEVPEGSTNLYYTDARVGSYLTANSYATESFVNTAVSNLVDSAPTTLDTLNELAAALGDDPNFATTVATQIGEKLATADFTSTADTWLATKSTTNLTEGANLYYTDARSRSSISVSGDLAYDSATGVISYSTPTNVSTFTNDAGYLTSANNLSDLSNVVTARDNLELGLLDEVQFAKLTVDDLLFTGTVGQEGMLRFNANEGTLQLTMSGGVVKQDIGESQYYMTNNSTLSAIPKGTPVHATGATPGVSRITIAPGIADGSVESIRFVGIAAEDIAAESNGIVASFGYIRNINTTGTSYSETWNVGDILYVSPTTAGGLTKVEPLSPNLRIVVAMVIKVHANNGVLLVRPTFSASIEEGNLATIAHGWGDHAQAGYATSLDELSDVDLTTAAPTDGQSLVYNAAASKWVPQTITGGGSGGGASVTTSDTAPVSPSSGDMWLDTSTMTLYVYYTDVDSSQWVQVSDGESPVIYSQVLANFNVRSYTGNGTQTEFEVSSGLYENGVIVTENGIVQFPGTDYTISGTTLTFTNAPAQDVLIQIREIAFTNIWQEVTATTTYQAVKGQKLFVDCSADDVTVVLPSDPVMGDEVTIVDAMGNSAINNITVSRNGSNITGVAEDLIIDINDAAITLAYYNATRGWLVISK